MRTTGFDRPLYILPFDHRGSFQTQMFGWKGALTTEQVEQISATKQVIYDGFKAAVTSGVPKERAGILVDEQFDPPSSAMPPRVDTPLVVPPKRVVRRGSISNTVRTSANTSRPFRRPSVRCLSGTTPPLTGL